jgi:hypothetical protein
VSQRLGWNGTVNTGGGSEHNIALHLNCEHHVCRAKDLLQHQGARVKFDIAQKVSWTIGEQTDLVHQYDKDFELKAECGKHSISSRSEDIDHIVSVLLYWKLFPLTPGRFYLPKFPELPNEAVAQIGL